MFSTPSKVDGGLWLTWKQDHFRSRTNRRAIWPNWAGKLWWTNKTCMEYVVFTALAEGSQQWTLDSYQLSIIHCQFDVLHRRLKHLGNHRRRLLPKELLLSLQSFLSAPPG